HRLGQAVLAHLAGRGIELLKRRAEDVDPPQRARALFPERALAEQVTVSHHAFDRGGHCANHLRKYHGVIADIPGARIWYEESGGGPPVVFLHASTGSSAVWPHQSAVFSQAGFRFIAHDRRGHGRTVLDLAGPQPGSAAEDLRLLMAHLKIESF